MSGDIIIFDENKAKKKLEEVVNKYHKVKLNMDKILNYSIKKTLDKIKLLFI